MVKLSLEWTETIYDFIETAAFDPRYREVACFGTRGDGKTHGAFGVMVAHAMEQQDRGYPLPVKWMGVTDTFESHKQKTCVSLEDPIWQGRWQLSDGKHLATFKANGGALVELSLFGIEDQGAMNRVRREAHCAWFEEAAPAAEMVSSSGVSDTAWGIAGTSLRLPSHKNVQILTENYPDDDHWTWQRFVVNQHPGSTYYRVPPGERASAELRAQWAELLKNRPDLARRLLAGEPGSVMLGQQVAVGFDSAKHTQRDVQLTEGQPLAIGWDWGHTPTAVIGQPAAVRQMRVVKAITGEGMGSKQLAAGYVKPWLEMHAPWAVKPHRHDLIQHCYDPSGDTGDQGDIDSTAIGAVVELLGGYAVPGPVPWPVRKDILLTALNSTDEFGEPSLVLDAVGCQDLVRALIGRWYYPQDRLGNISRDLPKKPNHPWEDYGDALIYLLSLFPWLRTQAEPHDTNIKVESDFDPRSYAVA